MTASTAQRMEPEPSAPLGTAHVALVNMPFAQADRPSIQCGLLKAGLLRLGHQVDVFYLNLELVAELGTAFYREISRLRMELLGEWLFSAAAFGYRPNEEEYEAVCTLLPEICKRLGKDFGELCQLRREVLPSWIDRWTEEIDWKRYAAVGFTCTFEQNAAAFALARSIKEKHPRVTLIFGGANFDGTMGKEYVRALPFIDYAVSGEGDEALPRIIERIIAGQSALGIPGVIGREDGRVVEGGATQRIHDMDSLPDPDYDEYFKTLRRLGQERILSTEQPTLLFESSRGCWWGEKQHCTFCGLNNNGMKYRAKSASGTADQLRRLAAKYKSTQFESVDNIMDYKYLEQLWMPLAEKHYDYRVFYEVKANLSPSQLRAMARAGITTIQPGIESLSSHVLALMRKGITMLRNVRLLKWAKYYGIRVNWNILTGFPGETDEDYIRQLRVLRLLTHFQPPFGANRIWLERFSPYFFDPAFPVSDVKPLKAYKLIYPQDIIDAQKIAYFFDYKMDSTLPDSTHDELRGAIADWRNAWTRKPRPELVYQRAPDWIQILDRRAEQPAAYSFGGQEAEIYEFCGDTERTAGAVRDHLCSAGVEAGLDDIASTLRNFCDLGLMLEENDRFLSLAHPINRHW
jgi:ribosomal peptide maturation radical SAM protein 1